MINASQLLGYRDRVIWQLQDKQQRLSELIEPQAETVEREAFEPLLVQALSRTNSMPVDGAKCPRCFIFDGKDVDLVPVERPEGGDLEIDYFQCAERCGFDNLHEVAGAMMRQASKRSLV